MAARSKRLQLSSLTLLLLSISLISKGQDLQDSISRKSYLKFSISYLTNSVYCGRKDTVVIPYVIPSLMYKDKSGLYVEGSLSYLAARGEAHVNAATLAAGYNFSGCNKLLTGDLYAAKYFISSDNTAANSTVKGAVAASLYYDFNIVTVNAGTDVFFSNKTDVVFTGGVSHAFDFGKNYSWSIEPSATINAGTDNFYEDYFTNKRYSVRRKRRIVNTVQPAVIVVKNNFAVLDYEASLPVRYDTKTWGLFITPTYALPVNPVKYSLNKGITYKTESLTNSLYTEFGLYIKI